MVLIKNDEVITWSNCSSWADNQINIPAIKLDCYFRPRRKHFTFVLCWRPQRDGLFTKQRTISYWGSSHMPWSGHVTWIHHVTWSDHGMTTWSGRADHDFTFRPHFLKTTWRSPSLYSKYFTRVTPRVEPRVTPRVKPRV